MEQPLLRKVDAITVKVPDLEAGLVFYRDVLGQPLLWRNDDIGQAAVGLPDSDTEIVLTTQHGYEPNWLVDACRARRADLAVVRSTRRTQFCVGVMHAQT